MLVLSLFPGIGLLDRAFEDVGFCIVRGPDLLWGGDVKSFSPPAGKFDGVIGGPPCQAHSSLRHMVKHNGYKLAEDLIPEYIRCVAEAQPDWYLMENVRDAPIPHISGYQVHAQMLKDVWCDGGTTMRMRRFSFGSRDGRPLHIETLALHSTQPELSALAAGGARDRPVAIGGSGKRKDRSVLGNLGSASASRLNDHLKAQGLPDDFDLPGFTLQGKIRAIGNGVPYAMGKAVAKAVREAISQPTPPVGRP